MENQSPRIRWGLWPFRRLVVAFGLLVFPSVALGAGSVTLKGRTSGAQKLLNPVWNEAKDPRLQGFTFREPSPTVRTDVRVLTAHLPKELCIVALGDDGKPDQRPLRVVLAGGRTTPVTLVVAPGQQIQFDNRDPFPHKLYDVGNKGLQPTETAALGQRSWTPPGPGKYEIRDKNTPSLRSWIVVEPKTVAVGFPDRKGEFAIELEPGSYRLRGFFNGVAVGEELEITVRPTPAEQLLKPPLVIAEPPPEQAKPKGKGR